ncbi:MULTISPECIES: LuxR C-terminal-related transcriptional regulator [Streptomyces]|uniref:Helix-turn-helix transcriptional regulator n=1 Tax=Streptomyces venezuelae TaxID=54571 RepID=A0A5P2AI79_STRVZ|nr:LuxR C-terminal-related transcriptional regulator [Streptomyces venezuelae]QES17843.1 helix-turn-helix transcriptional regulator [Streptomyces venezuelae]
MTGDLERGRTACGVRAWADGYKALELADRVNPLKAEDLELLAMSAFMTGRHEDMVSALERAYGSYLGTARALKAARCAFWAGFDLAYRRETGRATGWFGRAHRLVEAEEIGCVEEGYLLMPAVMMLRAGGDYAGAYATAGRAAEIGERFGDADLLALAMEEQGQALVREGRVEEGLGLLDEAMVAVTSGDLSPAVTGVVYCAVIDACRAVYELRRAQEWTEALTVWCREQPDMVAFSGECLVHRAEIMELHGAWREALAEAERAGERFRQETPQGEAGQSHYRQAEIHRLQGAFAAAEEGYRDASRCGGDPQPGLALLRLAQGNEGTAVAAMHRVIEETVDPLERARLLPACVEIMLAAGDTQAALSACDELGTIAERYRGGVLGVIATAARGTVELAAGEAGSALIALRKAERGWQELDAPYETARIRMLIGRACLALGDDETAALELEAARAVFAHIGAAPDVVRVDAIASGAPAEAAPGHALGSALGLTPREEAVLRLVAAGKRNREIASALVISEHTVARHVQNIFAKLDVSSRTAASAKAHEHHLV